MTRVDAAQALCGLGLIFAGCAMVSWPAALVVPGVILVGLAIFPRRRPGK